MGERNIHNTKKNKTGRTSKCSKEPTWTRQISTGGKSRQIINNKAAMERKTRNVEEQGVDKTAHDRSNTNKTV